MAAQNPPLALQGAGDGGILHPAKLFRQLVKDLAGGASGVFHTGDLAVAQNGTPNMSVNVAAGSAVIAGTATADQGSYYAYNDATVNLAIAAADATNPRIDIVVAKVVDTATDSDTWSLAMVTGTPAASPTPPSAPANSITLAQVAVAANATSIVNANITDKRGFAITDGFYLFGASPNYAGATPAASQRIHMQTGSMVHNTATGGLFGITFPTAFSTAVLAVLATPGDTTNGLRMIAVSAGTVTTAGATVVCYDGTGTVLAGSLSVRVNYIALGY